MGYGKLITSVVSFLTCWAGLTYKEQVKQYFRKFFGEETNVKHDDSLKRAVSTVEPAQSKSSVSGFNLYSIKYLFDRYGVDLMDENSFSVLLRKIERKTYTDTLDFFVNNATSPQELMNCLERKTERLQINPIITEKEIVISSSLLNNLFRSENISSDNADNDQKKVEELVIHYQGKGFIKFQQTIGPGLAEFIERYEKKGDDVNNLYNEIINNLKFTKDFMD